MNGVDAVRSRALPTLENRRSDVREAAQEFEAVMLRQMVEAFRRAARTGDEEEGSQMTEHLIEDALAGHLAKAGGIGLADTIAAAVEERERYSVPRADAHLLLEKGLRLSPPSDPASGRLLPGQAQEPGEHGGLGALPSRPGEPMGDGP